MTRIRAASGLLIAALMLTGCGGEAPTVNAAATPRMITVQIGASTLNSAGQVIYTCPDGSSSACGPEPIDGMWTRLISVPEGSVVRVQVANTQVSPVEGITLQNPRCWIADQTGRLAYVPLTENSCVAEIR